MLPLLKTPITICTRYEKQTTKKQIVRKFCDPKSIKKKKKKQINGWFFFFLGKILSFLMVGYKILSFLDVVEILITTTSKANEVANIHKKQKNWTSQR